MSGRGKKADLDLRGRGREEKGRKSEREIKAKKEESKKRVRSEEGHVNSFYNSGTKTQRAHTSDRRDSSRAYREQSDDQPRRTYRDALRPNDESVGFKTSTVNPLDQVDSSQRVTLPYGLGMPLVITPNVNQKARNKSAENKKRGMAKLKKEPVIKKEVQKDRRGHIKPSAKNEPKMKMCKVDKDDYTDSEIDPVKQEFFENIDSGRGGA